MTTADMTTLWRAAEAAKPSTWHLVGLRCTSTGIHPKQRSDRWLAEVCGPEDGCIRVEAATGEEALLQLTVKLKRLSP